MGEANRKLEEKKKKFEENPGDFVNNNEMIMGVKVGDDGKLELLLNPAHIKMFPAALGLLVLEAPVFNNFVKIQNKKKPGGIITPGGNGKSRFQA